MNPAAIREFAQTAEEIGYQDLSAPDHVLGVNAASRGDCNTSADLFHDPFVLFGFLAKLHPERRIFDPSADLGHHQAMLVGKQAASRNPASCVSGSPNRYRRTNGVSDD